ncbi:MAG: toll/interleukin-1 receptor domain-containing protein [Lachnospiraceae bacterium]|nr:toll/interleukin-1 receptor domain-containing protein [Lachnospiraceae bacterium]
MSEANRETHYNAFISYRHHELDKAVAIELHRKIERFRLPVNMRKDFPRERWGIQRVFRDQDELPLASNLSDPIEEALRNSEWLVVICTPRLPESKWCQKEIETFKALHGQDHILAILAEGEPDESFPEGIRFRDVTRTNENGDVVTVREEVEPLAADVRESDPRKRSRLIDDAVLRLAAPMYGLGYDDLKQRHREQRIRRIASVSAVCALVFLIFGICMTALSIKISDQKKTIESQHEELQEQYLQSRKKYEESMALVSGELLGLGRRQDALYAIRTAMPSSRDEEPELYSSAAQYALTNALGDYNVDMLVPDGVMELPPDDFWGDAGEYFYLENYLGGTQIICAEEFDESHVLIVTSDFTLYLYSPDDNTLLDYTATWLPEKPDEYVFGAAFRDDVLYIQFADAGNAVRYRFNRRDNYESAGNIEYSDYSVSRGPVLSDGEEAWSGDGRFMFVQKGDHTIEFFENGSDTPARTLYDIHGTFTGLGKLYDTGLYVLIGVNTSYLLNGDLEVIASVPGFYDYSPDKKALILFRNDSFCDHDNLIYVPLREYDDLIKEADSKLAGYAPSEEMRERYRMLDD